MKEPCRRLLASSRLRVCVKTGRATSSPGNGHTTGEPTRDEARIFRMMLISAQLAIQPQMTHVAAPETGAAGVSRKPLAVASCQTKWPYGGQKARQVN